jgi:hypothetical protein
MEIKPRKRARDFQDGVKEREGMEDKDEDVSGESGLAMHNDSDYDLGVSLSLNSLKVSWEEPPDRWDLL